MKKSLIPFYDPKTDGVTQGLLVSFMTCRQIQKWSLQGWSSKGTSMALVHGDIVHNLLQDIYTDIRKKKLRSLPSQKELLRYSHSLEKRWEQENPKVDKITFEFKEKSFLLAEITLPLYFEYWHKDFKEMQWQAVEGEFAQPFPLLDGRSTILRGKRDGVFKNKGKVWLFETKNKSRIDERNLVDILPMDFQNLFYLHTLKEEIKEHPAGVLYNIIRRIGLEQRKNETSSQFALRCKKDIEKRPDWYFIRMEIAVSPKELSQFGIELHGLIEDFLNWWEGSGNHYRNTSQCETKYGRCSYLGLCSGENFNLYIKRKKVFRELSDY